MEYTDDFKTKVFRICRFVPVYAKLMKALEENKHNSVRIMLEDLVDDNLLYNEYTVDDKVVKKVREDKKYTYTSRVNLYSEFMEMYTQYLDDGRLLQENRLYL
jgi:translation elongation factor P/translation initiation factor 5A